METTLLNALTAFLSDTRMLVLVGLVFLDLLFGVAAALRTGTFQFSLVGQWYIKNVFPYVIVYAGLYAISIVGISAIVSPTVGDLAAYASAAPAVASLADSIQRNIRTLALATPPAPEA